MQLSSAASDQLSQVPYTLPLQLTRRTLDGFDMSRLINNLPIITCCLFVLMSCDSSNRDHENSSVPVVQTSPSPLHEGQLYDLSLDLELGIDDGEPAWQVFGFITHLLVAPDGRIVIPDRRRLEVFIVNPDGSLLSRVGRKGQGPGEFSSIWGIIWAETGAEFWVRDTNLLRFNCFSMDGTFIRSQHYGRQQGLYDYFIGIGNRTFLALTSADSGRRSATDRYSFISEEIEAQEDFIEVPPQQVWKDPKLGGWGAIPFTVSDGITVFPDGRILSYHPYLPRLTCYTSSGEPILHIAHNWEFPPVTAYEKERFRSNFRDNPRNETFKHWATDMPIPDKHAAFDLVLADDMDRIWVRRVVPAKSQDDEPSHLFDVFDSMGTWLGSQDLPYRPAAFHGMNVFFIYSAESGSPRIGRYQLIPN